MDRDTEETIFKDNLAWPTVQRLTEYLIILEQHLENNKEVISSSELAEIYSNTASQVRQDIFRLPNTGRVGQGYNVKELASTIRKVLGLDIQAEVIIAGCGKMGTALAQHVPFSSYGMRLAALFDKDPEIVGSKIGDITVSGVAVMESLIKDKNIKIAALCVPYEAAQDTTDKLVDSGINAILNFTRKRLKVPRNVFVQHRQIICSFMQLSFMSRNLKNLINKN